MRFFLWLMLAERLVKMHFQLISSEGVNLMRFYDLQTILQMYICFLQTNKDEWQNLSISLATAPDIA